VRLQGKDVRGKEEIIRTLKMKTSAIRSWQPWPKASMTTNTGDADFFFASQAISLMLQPVVLTGEAAGFAPDSKLTIPDVVHALEKNVHVKKGDFNPLPCSHYSCFALAYYFILEQNRFLNLKDFLGREDYLNAIANKTLPGLDSEGFDLIRNKLYDVWSLADAGSMGESALRRIQYISRFEQGRLSKTVYAAMKP
jgi:hypothetical protein